MPFELRQNGGQPHDDSQPRDGEAKFRGRVEKNPKDRRKAS